MRVKLLFSICMVMIAGWITPQTAFAYPSGCGQAPGVPTCTSCSGYCGVQSCTYWTYYPANEGSCSGGTPPNTDGDCGITTCFDENTSCSSDDPYSWCPDGYPNVTCSKTCLSGTACGVSGGSCISETWDNVLCNCEPTPTPDGGGGGGGGGGTGTPTPTPTGSPLIQGSIHTDTTAALSGSYCAQGSEAPLTLTGWSLAGTGSTGTHNATFGFANPHTYSINTTSTGTGYTVSLDLSGQVGTDYVCSCPAPHDPNDPYRCRYTGVTSPTANVNFYLRERDLSNDSWFQVFGSNLFAAGLISSAVPTAACEDDADCQAALAAAHPALSNPLASGFPISGAGNANSIRSSVSEVAYHSAFHLAERPSNLNSYALNTTLANLSYDYFYQIAQNQATELGNGEDLEPLLSDWTGSAWWQADEVNYVHVDGNVSIDETQGFQLSAGQQLVVFVDGRLTFDDSNPNDTNRKITSVANGGFLAFFASGDIWVTPHVGYELDPDAPTVPAVTLANSNLEGVFVADDNLIIQSKTAIGEVPPDKKFIGAGTFVGWGNVLLNRTFNDNDLGPILNNNQAIENFIYRSDLLVNWPTKLKASTSNWREVDPQLIQE